MNVKIFLQIIVVHHITKAEIKINAKVLEIHTIMIVIVIKLVLLIDVQVYSYIHVYIYGCFNIYMYIITDQLEIINSNLHVHL